MEYFIWQKQKDGHEMGSLHFLQKISDTELENRLLSSWIPLVRFFFPSKLNDSGFIQKSDHNLRSWSIGFHEALELLAVPSPPIACLSDCTRVGLDCGISKQCIDRPTTGKTFSKVERESNLLPVAIIPSIPTEKQDRIYWYVITSSHSIFPCGNSGCS